MVSSTEEEETSISRLSSVSLSSCKGAPRLGTLGKVSSTEEEEEERGGVARGML